MTSRSNSEHLLVQVLMHAAQEVLRTLAELPEGAPERERARHELELAFAPIWSRLPAIELTLDDGKLLWEQRPVLAPEEDAFGLARTLVTSGVHGVTLTRGVERDEMMLFLEIVDQKRRLDEDGDQDLVLMLFRADLHHLRYSVGPVRPESASALPPADGSGGPPAADRRVSPERLRFQVREDAESVDGAGGIVQLERFDSTLYFLDEREIEYLRGAIDREYSRDHARSVLDLLFDVLQLQAAPEIREEVIEVLEKLLPYLLGTGQFNSVAYLTGELRTVTRNATFDERHKEALDRLRISISRTGALSQLFHVLEGGDVEPTPEQLSVLLRELRPEAVQTVLVWMGRLTRPSAKSALIEALEGFFRQWPIALARMTAAADRTVVQRALGIAGKLKLPDFAGPVGEALDAKEASTRRMAVTTLRSIGTTPAIKLIAKVVDDPDPDVRVAAFSAFASRPYRGALKSLTAQVKAPDLESRDVSERRALFKAFGVTAGGEGLALLEQVLLGKGGIARRPSAETRACAAVALGTINAPQARSALKAATKDRDPLVRSAASSELREGVSR